ncbi:MAG: hypothetical protein WCP97_01065 [bacterium]
MSLRITVLVLSIISLTLLTSCRGNNKIDIISKNIDAQTQQAIDLIKEENPALANVQPCTQFAGCSSDIEYKLTNGKLYLTFWLGDNCNITGCPDRHLWYYIYENNEATLTGEDIRGKDPLRSK